MVFGIWAECNEWLSIAYKRKPKFLGLAFGAFRHRVYPVSLALLPNAPL